MPAADSIDMALLSFINWFSFVLCLVFSLIRYAPCENVLDDGNAHVVRVHVELAVAPVGAVPEPPDFLDFLRHFALAVRVTRVFDDLVAHQSQDQDPGKQQEPDHERDDR